VRALELSLRQCDYESVRLFTDDMGVARSDSRIELVAIPRIASSADYSRFVLKDLFHHVDTDFVQVIQWDGYVTNGAAWSEEFLAYDYIGARWWFREEGRDVGNGGFSLRSRKLLAALQDPQIAAGDPEDNAICLDNRDLLEKRHGIRIAPGAVADRYSFEGNQPTGKEFGFHRLFNFPYFHDEAQLASVLDAVPDESFISGPTVTMLQKLARMERRREALRYAKRIHADAPRFAAFHPQFRANLERLMLGLVPRAHPCPCGSALPYKRCCGDIAKWSGTAR
jgi:hypothetical protein